jgi:hypothetical protein
MRRYGIDLIALGGLGLLAGCPDRAVSAVNTGQQGAVTKEIPVSADLDILFVIDDSASTGDKQMLFQSNFGNFVTALDSFPTGRPNLHMGVVTSTVDDGKAAATLSTNCPSPNTSKDGILQMGTGSAAPSGRYISDVAGPNGSASPRQTNYTGQLQDAFASIAAVGAGGCGFEADLEGMKRALDGSHSQNQGFIRDGAYLAVIFLTDEDDASLKDGSDGEDVFSVTSGLSTGAVESDFRVQPLYAYNCDTPIGAGSGSAFYTDCVPRTDSYLQDPAYYSSFLSGVKDPARTVVGVVAAPPPPPFQTDDNPPQSANITYGSGANTIGIGELTIGGNPPQDPALLPSCSTTLADGNAIGRPAIRMASFLSAYGERGKFYNICQSDYGAALTDIGDTLFNAISPCLEGPVDTSDADPNNPGTQLQCTVNDVLNQGGSDQTETLIPACTMANSANTGAMCNTAPCPASGTATPCWWTDQNTTSCPSPDTGYELNIFRSTPAATGTTVDVQCAVVAQ